MMAKMEEEDRIAYEIRKQEEEELRKLREKEEK